MRYFDPKVFVEFAIKHETSVSYAAKVSKDSRVLFREMKVL